MIDTVQKTQGAITYFKIFFRDEMISHTVHHTGLYSAQTNIEKGSIGVHKNEKERYIGVLFRMSTFPARSYKFYWKLDNSYEPICQIFSKNHFEIIKRFIHFNDNIKVKN